jgi:hypothetical protein
MAKKDKTPKAAPLPKIRLFKQLLQEDLAKTTRAHARAIAKSESVRWNTHEGTDSIRKEERLAGRELLLEQLLQQCADWNVPDIE